MMRALMAEPGERYVRSGTTMAATETVSPGVSLDPRAIRSRAAILEAAGAMLVELGPASLTIEGVAERSGVAKTTIYRHWPSRSRLILDAFESLFQTRGRGIPKGDIREQLMSLAKGLVRGLTLSRWAPAMAGLFDAAERDDELMLLVQEFLRVRMGSYRIVVKDAIDRGELLSSLDVDMAVSAICGPIFYRRLVSREPLDDEYIEQVIDQFLRGARVSEAQDVVAVQTECNSIVCLQTPVDDLAEPAL